MESHLKNAAAPAPSSLAGGEVETIFRIFKDNMSGPGFRGDEINAAHDEDIRTAARAILAALSPEAPARETEDDGTIYLMLQGMRSWALEMIRKHGDPNGTDYEQGQNDMGHRWVSSIDERLARMTAPTPRETADHIGEANEKVTADHAELARKFEALAVDAACARNLDGAESMMVSIQTIYELIVSRNALLSEIAALRGGGRAAEDTSTPSY